MRNIVQISAISVLLLGTVFLNRELINIRIYEMNYLLGQAAQEEQASDTLSVLSKYALIKNRLEQGESQVANYQLEAKIQALSSNVSFEPVASQGSVLPVRLILRGLRRFLGKSTVEMQADEAVFSSLEIAYILERNRQYAPAIEMYNQLLATQTNLQPEMTAAVLLHQGFCYSMLGENKRATMIFQRIISDFPDTEAGVLSWKILEFLQAMELKRSLVKKEELAPFESGKQSYLLMDYNDTLAQFNIFIKESPGDARMAEARYYKGRAHEEKGEFAEAIREYKRITYLDTSRNWTKEAYRRLYMMGTFYEENPQLADEARVILDRFQDNRFIAGVEPYSEITVFRAPDTVIETPEQTEKEKPSKEPVKLADLYVETDPPGATLKINGESRGISPTLITGIPFGLIEVEARKGELHGTRSVLIDSTQIAQVFIHLPKPFPLLARSQRPTEFRLDPLPEGVQATPLATTDTAEPALAENRGPQESEADGVQVALADPGPIQPQASGQARTVLPLKPSPLPDQDAPEQIDRAALQQALTALQTRRTTLQQELSGLEERRKKSLWGTWISLGVGVGALGGTGAAFYYAEEAYGKYDSAAYTEDAVAYREQTVLLRNVGIASAVLGGLGLSASTVFWLTGPKVNRIQRELKRIGTQIEKLQAQLGGGS